MANNIPTVSGLPRDLQQFVQRVKEALDGNGLDSVVTARQLVAAGIAGSSTGTGVVTNTGSTVGTPRPPTSLAASGALASIIVTWDGPGYSGHAYTEVWAAAQSAAQVSANEDPLLADAVLVGMNAGNSFSHQIGSAANRWYWARNINQNGVAGAYNATAGVKGTTGTNPNYVMDVLSQSLGGSSEAPFFQIDAATVINGVSVPAGTYIRTAMIADATITNAQIGSLTADKITASLLNTVDFYGNTIAGAEIYLGGTVNYSQTGGVNTGISSVTAPAATLDTNGATFNVGAFRVNNLNGAGFETPFQVVNNHVFIKAANIEDATIVEAKIGAGAITNAKIGNVIQSADYASGSAGWKIDKAGAMEMNNATFRGTLATQSAASGARLEIAADTVKVFDASGTVRVKLGNLA